MLTEYGLKIDKFNRWLLINNISISDFWEDNTKSLRLCKLAKKVLKCRCENDYKKLVSNLGYTI